jgi:hypothetical protein
MLLKSSHVIPSIKRIDFIQVPILSTFVVTKQEIVLVQQGYCTITLTLVDSSSINPATTIVIVTMMQAL